MEKYRELDLFTLELGNGFCSKHSLDEILRITVSLRDEIFEQFGVVIPSISVKNNSQLKSLEYVIKLNGMVAGSFTFKKNFVLIVDTGNAKGKMEGKECEEPVFGAEALMVPVSMKEEAFKKGYTVLTSQKVIHVNLAEIIKENLSSVITTQYVSELLEDIGKENKPLYSQLFKKYENKTYQIVKDVLKNLLEEEVGIRNMLPILETIADEERGMIIPIPSIISKARCAIAQYVISPFLKNNQFDFAVVVPEFSDYLVEHEKALEEFVYDNSVRLKFINELTEINNQHSLYGIVCHSKCRRILKKYLTNFCLMPKIPVFSEIEYINAIRKLNFKSNLICEIGKDIGNPKGKQKNREELCEEIKKDVNAQNSNSGFSKEAFTKLKKNVRDVLENLQPLEQKMLVMRFGLDDGVVHSLEEIEKELDVSKEEIRRIEAKVLRMLRHPRNEDCE